MKQGLRQIVSEIVVDIRRSPLGYFISNSELKSIEIGGMVPRIDNIKVITGSSLKEPSSESPLALKFDLDYEEGDCRLLIGIETIFKIKFFINLVIKRFNGSICIIIEDKTLHFCLLNEESTIVNLDAKISFKNTSSFEIPFLNYLISKGGLIKRGIFIGCGFPKFLNQWYRDGPAEQPPYPWDSKVISDPELLYNWKPKSWK